MPDRGKDRDAARDARRLSFHAAPADPQNGERYHNLLLAAESDCEKRSREQFTKMLFAEEGEVRIGGYRDLVALQKPIREGRTSAFQAVLNAARRRARKQGSGHETVSMEGIVADYLDVRERQRVLQSILSRFEMSGRPPTLWEFLQESDEREEEKLSAPFKAQLQAIRKIATNPEELDGLRYNSELYRCAAEAEGLPYEEPEDAFRKSIGRNFEARFGEEPPGNPEEWKAFFSNGRAPESGQDTNSRPSATDSGQDNRP
jgi:hypothetical protein